MTPTFDITFQGRSLFERLHPFLVSLSLTDEPGLKSDRLDLVLAHHNLELPQTGEVLNVRLGYKETGLFDMGTFVIDGYTLTATELRIAAHAANFLENFKSPRSRTFTNASLETIVQTIAQAHGIPAKTTGLPDVIFPTMQQAHESDLHFLTRLATQFNLQLKPAGGALVALPVAASGPFPVVTLRPNSVLSWSFQLSKRDETPSVTARGYDLEDASEFRISAGNDESEGYVLRDTYSNRDAAQAAAQAVYDKLAQKTYTFSAKIVGDPAVMAESTLLLEGFPAGIPFRGRVSRTTHSLTTSGYRTVLDAILEKNVTS